MATREAVEAVVVVISLGGFITYHVWLFLFRGRGSKVSKNLFQVPEALWSCLMVQLIAAAVILLHTAGARAHCLVMRIGGERPNSKPSEPCCKCWCLTCRSKNSITTTFRCAALPDWLQAMLRQMRAVAGQTSGTYWCSQLYFSTS